MIAEEQRELITAGVDGELTPSDARRLERLLAESSAARMLFAQLQQTRERLANLPKHQPPAGLRERILAKLSTLPPYNAPVVEPARSPRKDDSRRSRRAPIAVAAAIYFVLAGGSLVYFTRDNNPQTKHSGNGVVKGQINSATFLPPDDQHPSTPHVTEPGDNNIVRVEQPQGPRPEVGPFKPDNLTPTPAPSPTLFTFPPLPPIAPFANVQARIPFLASMSELEREDIRQQFLAELGRDPAYRLDLFTTDTARAAEHFQNTAKGQGITLFADAAALDRMKRKQPAAYVIYSDSLTAAELRDLLTKLATDDAKGSQRAFEMVHATPISVTDQNEFRGVFGTTFDLSNGKRVPATTTPNEASTKPLSAGTADQLAKSLNKQTDKAAVLMGINVTPAAMSKELAQYRQKRGERRPGTVPVMIVIRVTSG